MKKQIYDGASYEAVGEKTVTGIIIDPDKAIPTASFENTYDGKMITGGISAVNEFVEDNGEQFWLDESGQRVKQEVRVREQYEIKVVFSSCCSDNGNRH